MSFTVDQVAFLEANSDTVEAVMCLELQFTDGTVRLCDAPRDRVIDGETWLGMGYVDRDGVQGSWIEASPIRRQSMFEAEEVTYAVSQLTADLATAVLHDAAKYKGRKAIRSVQLFAAGVAVGPRIVLHTGRMADARASESSDSARVVLTVEGRFKNRNRVPAGTYTDVDQQVRSPGDRGLEYIHTFVRKVVLKGWLRG